MTATTRRRLTVCFVLGLVTLPAEALLLPVARTRDPRVAATRVPHGEQLRPIGSMLLLICSRRGRRSPQCDISLRVSSHPPN